MGVCGLVSAAIAERIEGAQIMVSKPGIPAAPTMEHAVTVFEREGERFVIDASYTQFLAFAGLSEGYVHFGGVDTFPKDKIAVFKLGEHSEVVDQLVAHARVALDTYVAPDEKWYNSNMEFKAMDDAQIRAQYTEIWSPANFHPLTLQEDRKGLVRKMAALIPDEAVALID